MKYIHLKDTDLNLSNICLGTVNFGEKLNREQTFEILDEFVRLGGNFLDTANVYGRWVAPTFCNMSEKLIGEWMKKRGAYNNVVVATKGAHYDLSTPTVPRVEEKEIRIDIEDSLRTLGLDVLDFYWLHRDDLSKPIEEIMDVLENLRAEGKIRYYGLSNYTVERLEQARNYLQKKGLKGPYGVSNQWSLAEVDSGKETSADPTMVPCTSEEYEWHRETQVPLMPYSSTAFGLFEKMRRTGVQVCGGELLSGGIFEAEYPNLFEIYWNEKNLQTYEKLLEVQKETGHSMHALSVAWLFSHPFQVFGLGSVRSCEQLKELAEASEIEWD